MGFILDGLDTEAYDRNYSDRELLARMLSYFRPHTGKMALVAVMIALNSAAGTGGPILISSAIDLLAENPSTQAILLMAGGILLLGAAAWLFNFIRQFVSARVVGDVVLKLREDVFDATIGHDLSFYDEHPSGKIVSRVTSDTQDFAQVATLIMNLLSQVLLVVILSVWLVGINVLLTFLLLAMTPVAVAIALSFRKVARRVTLNARRVTAKINAQIQESISGIMVAKSFRQERAIYDDFDANNKQAYRVGLRRGLTLMHHLSGHGALVRAGGGAADLRWRPDDAGWTGEPGQLVSVYAGGGLLLVAADEHRFVLEPVSGRALGRRASLCADRRRAQGAPDGSRTGGTRCEAGSNFARWPLATTRTKWCCRT